MNLCSECFSQNEERWKKKNKEEVSGIMEKNDI